MKTRTICFWVSFCLIFVSCSVGDAASARAPARVVRSPLETRNSGLAYMAECDQAGVPVPKNVLDSAWVNHGRVDDPFLSPNLEAELWSWSPGPQTGLCLALPRWDSNAQASLFGVICQSFVTAKVCFWDNQRFPTPIFEDRAAAGTTGYPLTRFLGGADLDDGGDQFKSGGMCSNCHAGANAFVVHPEKDAFRDLSNVRAPLMNTSIGWYEPLVPVGWYLNERREKRQFVPDPMATPTPASCWTCHNAGAKAELPELSTLLKLTPGNYCNSVLAPAVTRQDETMPKGRGMIPMADFRLPYAAHITKLQGYCDEDPPGEGRFIPFEPGRDDDQFLSPPLIVQPVYTCGASVGVAGAVPNARVTLTITNIRTGAVTVLTEDWDQRFSLVNFALPAPLDEDDWLFATQELNGVVSGMSLLLDVDDYPFAALPTPTFAPDTIFECANTVSVRGTPGAQLEIAQDGYSPVTASTSDGWAIVSPGAAPWTIGAKFTAVESLSCVTNNTSKSWASDTEVAFAIERPLVLLTPAFEPPQMFVGQDMIGIRNVTFGAYSKLSRTAMTPLFLGNTAPAPDGWGANFLLLPSPLQGPVALGEKFSAEPSLYCPNGPTGNSGDLPGVRSCSEMPPPTIEAPLVGATFVSVLDSMPGARIRIWDAAGDELGDGSGPVIFLRRAVVAGDELIAVQDSGECRGSSGFLVLARERR